LRRLKVESYSRLAVFLGPLPKDILSRKKIHPNIYRSLSTNHSHE